MCSYRTGMQINFSLVDICMPTWTQITHRQFTQHKSNRFLDLRISAGTFLRQLPDTLSCVSLPHPRGPHSSRLYVCCAFAFFYGSITSVYITLLVWRLHKHWIACSLLRLFFIYHFVFRCTFFSSVWYPCAKMLEVLFSVLNLCFSLFRSPGFWLIVRNVFPNSS